MSLRSVGRKLTDRLVESLPREDMLTAAGRLGMLGPKSRDGKAVLVVDSEDEMTVMMDHAIHNVYRDGRNAVDRCLEEIAPAAGSPERRFLESMQRAIFSIFVVEEPIRGVGARVCNVFSEDRYLVIDMGFGHTAQKGWAVACHLHSPGDFWMTTGAAVPVLPEALDALTKSLRALEKTPEGFIRGATLSPEAIAVVVRECLRSHALDHMAYGPASDDPAELEREMRRKRQELSDNPRLPAVSSGRPVVAGPRTGRNEPCPCGSGKKYKKCCGR